MEQLEGNSSMAQNPLQNFRWTRAESDLCSWMLLNGEDLFPPPDVNPPRSSRSPRFPQHYPASSGLAPETLQNGLRSPGGRMSLTRSNSTSLSVADLDHNVNPIQDTSLPRGLVESGRKEELSMRTLMKRESSVSEASAMMDPTEKKKLERLERNREIARNCRKRKREKIEAMESELNDAKEKIKKLELRIVQMQRLQASMKSSDQCTDSTKNGDNTVVAEIETLGVNSSSDVRKKEFKEIDKILQKYDELVSAKNEVAEKDKSKTDKGTLPGLRRQIKECEDQLKKKLNLLKEYHSDFGKERANEIKFHMKELERLLVPNQLSKLTLWSLQQEDDFYDEKANSKKFGGGIWNTLCDESRFTREQKIGLMNMRGSIKNQWKNIAKCVKILEELDTRVKTNFEGLKANMSRILEITTPIQQAKLLMWIDKNQACMYMLNSLWEQERKSASPPELDVNLGESELKLESSTSRSAEVEMEHRNEDTHHDDEVESGSDTLEMMSKSDVTLPKETMEQAFQSTRNFMAMKESINKSGKVM